MVAAVVLGIVAGVIGICPLFLARHLSRRGSKAVRDFAIPIGMGCTFVSFAVLLVMLFVASSVAGDAFAAFGIALVATFLAGSAFLALRAFKRD